MNSPKLKFAFLAFVCLWFFAPAAKADELWLKNIPVKQLQELYNRTGYTGAKGFLMLPDHNYPPVFLKNFPSDYNTVTDETQRNALFIKILTPLALKLNQELKAERKTVEDIAAKFAKDNKLSAADIKTIETSADKYDIFSRLKGSDRYSFLIQELLNRIDAIPPSIMITAAALETNWGTSRIVKEGNSLYKMLVWHTGEGLKPKGETEDDSYRIKTYPDIYASMRDFALKINSHNAFETMRNMRRERRERNAFMSGLLLAPYTYGSSNLRNYAGIFDYTLAYYELLEIDKSSLKSNMITADIIKEYKNYVTKM